MVAYVVDYRDDARVHRVSGADVSVESSTPRTLGPVVDGVSAGGQSLCNQVVHGVMGFILGPGREIPGLCATCEETYTVVQRREVLPRGWDAADLAAYWVGFDRGRSFADFMEHHRANAFGDETIETPHGISMGTREWDRFSEGVEDGVRSYVIDGWSPRW